ncbi:hypothetical protein [Streptomyces bauhiniae]|uniref:hypothetical protein n=1 Tax=Streptomyces bauhiniae TaxID=2340725 RepID=UPI00366419BB
MEQLLDVNTDGDVYLAASGVSDVGGSQLLTPKRPTTERAGAADAFPYYAGFSFDWACSRLQRIEDSSRVVLDPWNGSGTTTLAAQTIGLRSVGIDLNPVANKIAQLRSQVSRDTPILPSPRKSSLSVDKNDGLHSWFTEPTAARIRDWTRCIAQKPEGDAGLALVAVFRAVRKATKFFEGSNPTWVKQAKSVDELIDIDVAELDAAIILEQEFLSGRLSSLPMTVAPTALFTASANSLPLRDECIDVILTSPPYLTRIDYAVAYARELAILGVNIARDRTLRTRLMGTTLIRKEVDLTFDRFGPRSQMLLRAISEHKSKASGGYYLKQAIQYLSDLNQGVAELSRVARDGADLHLVVQDSYYKDVPVPLADICIEEAEARGWHPVECKPYPVKRNLTRLNTSARAYKKGDVAETVISFKKGRHG